MNLSVLEVNEKECALLKTKKEDVLYGIDPAETLFGFTCFSNMIPPFSPESTLILGYGYGTVAKLINKIWGNDLKIVGVDKEIYAHGKHEFINIDAFKFIKYCDKFDYIVIDLWDEKKVPDFVYTEEFAERISAICNKMMCINIPETDVQKLGFFYNRGFIFERYVKIYGNIVTFCSKKNSVIFPDWFKKIRQK